MTAPGQVTARGGAPVGALDDLPPVGRLTVQAFRGWRDGAEDRDALGALCRLCLEGARRPLARHGAGCPCLGADEACLAHLVLAASDGAREDALMIAGLVTRWDLAPALVRLAESAGLALRRDLVLRERRTALH